MTADVLLPELNGLRSRRNEMGRSLIFFFSTQWNELLLGIKKSDIYLSLHFGRQRCAPREENSHQCLVGGVHWLFIPFIALQYSPFNHKCCAVAALLGKPQVTRGAAQGSEGQGHKSP